MNWTALCEVSRSISAPAVLTFLNAPCHRCSAYPQEIITEFPAGEGSLCDTCPPQLNLNSFVFVHPLLNLCCFSSCEIASGWLSAMEALPFPERLSEFAVMEVNWSAPVCSEEPDCEGVDMAIASFCPEFCPESESG